MSNREEILREYYWMQQRVAHFDERQISIKSWGTTASGALIGFGFSESLPVLFLLAAISSIVFWYIDAQWKSFQIVAIRHGSSLENLLHEEQAEYTGPSINAYYDDAFGWRKKTERFWYSFFQSNVCVPYLPLGLIAIALWAAVSGHFAMSG